MTQIDVKSTIKQSAYVSISLACFAFVFWQIVQCIEKFIENPQGTKLSLQHTSEIHQFPAITICPRNQTKYKYEYDHLKECGLRYDNLFFILQLKIIPNIFLRILNSVKDYKFAWQVGW